MKKIIILIAILFCAMLGYSQVPNGSIVVQKMSTPLGYNRPAGTTVICYDSLSEYLTLASFTPTSTLGGTAHKLIGPSSAGGGGGGADTSFAHIDVIRPHKLDTIIYSTSLNILNNTSLFPNGTQFNFYSGSWTATQSIRNANCTYYTFGNCTFTKTDTGALFKPNKYTTDFIFMGSGTTFNCKYGIIRYDTVYAGACIGFYLNYKTFKVDSTDAFYIDGNVWYVNNNGGGILTGNYAKVKAGTMHNRAFYIYQRCQGEIFQSYIYCNTGNSSFTSMSDGLFYISTDIPWIPLTEFRGMYLTYPNDIWAFDLGIQGCNFKFIAQATTGMLNAYNQGYGKFIRIRAIAPNYVGGSIDIQGIMTGDIDVSGTFMTFQGFLWHSTVTRRTAYGGEMGTSMTGTFNGVSFINNAPSDFVINGNWNDFDTSKVNPDLGVFCGVENRVSGGGGRFTVNAECVFNFPTIGDNKTGNYVGFYNSGESFNINGNVKFQEGNRDNSVQTPSFTNFFPIVNYAGELNIKGIVTNNVRWDTAVVTMSTALSHLYLNGGTIFNNSTGAKAVGVKWDESGRFTHNGGSIITNCSSKSMTVASGKTVDIRNLNNYYTTAARGGAGSYSEKITSGGTEIVDSYVNNYAAAPTSVGTSTITDILNTTATGGGVIYTNGSNGSPIYLRGICWSTSLNPTLADDTTHNGSGEGSFISYMTGLTPGTLYHVRSYAINCVGISYGSDLSFTTQAGGGGDAYCKLLLHLNNNWTDASSSGHTVTGSGGVFTNGTYTQYKFGNYAWIIGGGSVTSDVSSDFDLTSGDFTLDFWLFPLGNNGFFFEEPNTSGYNSLSFGLYVMGSSMFFITSNPTGSAWDVNISGTITDSQWQHVEIDRSGTTYYYFINGILQGSTTTANSLLYDSHPFVWHGAGTVAYIDEVHFRKGIATHTSGFTVPSAEY